MKYRIDRLDKSKSDIMAEDIINKMSHELWKNSDYAVAYYLGVIFELKVFAKALKKPQCMSSEDCLAVMKTLKNDEVPAVIKDIIDEILKEFDKSNTKPCRDCAYNQWDTPQCKECNAENKFKNFRKW